MRHILPPHWQCRAKNVTEHPDCTLPVSEEADQAVVPWKASYPLPEADAAFGSQTNEMKESVSAWWGAPPIQLLPFRPFGFFPFTAPATLTEMNWKITDQEPDYNTDTHPPVSCWEPPVGMFTVWRVNSLIPSGMFPLGGVACCQTTNPSSPSTVGLHRPTNPSSSY